MSVSKGRVLVIMCVAVGVIIGSAGSARGDGPGERIRAKPARTELQSPVVEVPLHVGTGQPLVRVLINDRGPFRFLLDTGAAVTKLDDDVADGLQLRPVRTTEIRSASEGSPSVLDVYHLDSITLRDVVFSDVEAVVIDYDEVFGGIRRYEGALGLSVFADTLLTIDYPRGYVVLKQGELPAADGQEILDYKERDGTAMIRISFGRTSADAAIDSGMAGAFALDKSLEGRIELSSESTKPDSIADQLGIDVTPLKGAMRLGKYELVEPPVFFFGSGSVLGHKVLKHFIVTLDQMHHRVRFARDGNSRIKFGPKWSFGIVVGSRRGHIAITSVTPGSYADTIGLQAGDLILTVEGRPAWEYDVHGLNALMEEVGVIDMKVRRGGINGLPLLVRLKAEP